MMDRKWLWGGPPEEAYPTTQGTQHKDMSVSSVVRCPPSPVPLA